MSKFRRVIIGLGAIGVMGVAALILIPIVHSPVKHAQTLSARNDLLIFNRAIKDYSHTHGQPPPSTNWIAELRIINPEIKGLIDPWGNQYSYQVIDGQAVVYSAGLDCRFDTDDDIKEINTEQSVAGYPPQGVGSPDP